MYGSSTDPYWTIRDFSANYCKLILNKTTVDEYYWNINKDWNAPHNLTFTIKDLPPGIYNFTVIAIDNAGNKLIKSYIIQITPYYLPNPTTIDKTTTESSSTTQNSIFSTENNSSSTEISTSPGFNSFIFFLMIIFFIFYDKRKKGN